MPYIGQDLQVAYPTYLNIDDISGSFDGVTTSFSLLVSGSAPVPLPLNSQQCLISVGGVIQRPDDSGTEGFRLSGGNIIFSSAPNTGEDFFGVILAGADYVNVGANFPDGSQAAPSITFEQDNDTGFYRSGSGLVSVSANNTKVFTFPSTAGSNGQYLQTDGAGTATWASVASDKISEGNTEAEVVDTGSNGHFKVTTEGSERLRVDPSGRLLVGTTSSRNDFFNDTATVAGGIQLELSASDNLNRFMSFVSNNSDTAGPCLIFGKSRGTSANSKTVVQADDTIAQLSFQAADGSDMVPAAQISAAIDGTPGANDMPGRLVFSTTADGASSPTERMRIDRNGNLTNCLGIYNNTTAAPANMFVGAAGDLGRSTSSGKYKTDVETVELGYSENLLGCRPVWYRSLCEKDNPNWGYWGFIAEEVAEIDPRLVYWKTTKPVVQENGSIEHVSCDPEPEGVAYDRFVPHLLNLIKRQKEQIEAMEARLTALEQS